MVDISTIKEPPRKRKRPTDRHRLHRWLNFAMEYYRLMYIQGETRQRAIEQISKTKPYPSISTIKSAISYYSETTREGRERLQKSPAYGIYREYQVYGSIIDAHVLKGKPLPYWLTCWSDQR